jgi:hypothetical protein
MATESRLRRAVDWSSAIWAGVIAGAIFMTLEMILVPAFGMGGPWGPPRMIAAIVLGQEVLPPPETFDLGVAIVAMLVHFALSIAYAIVLGLLVHRSTTATSTLIGAGYGLALYLINFYLFTVAFPWFAMARNGVSIFAHLVFGAVAAAAYKVLQHRHERRVPVGRPTVPRPA